MCLQFFRMAVSFIHLIKFMDHFLGTKTEDVVNKRLKWRKSISK